MRQDPHHMSADGLRNKPVADEFEGYRLDDINEGYRDQLNGEIVRGVIDFSLD